MRINDKYTNTTFNADDMEQAKLKLKNECPTVLGKFVAELESNAASGLRKTLGLKAKAPLAVAALAELQGQSFVESKVSPFEKAKAYIQAAKDRSAKAAMPLPAPKRTPSTSSQSSLGSKKSVSFAEADVVATFFKDAVPTELDRG